MGCGGENETDSAGLIVVGEKESYNVTHSRGRLRLSLESSGTT
jgi:hypothetical protein